MAKRKTHEEFIDEFYKNNKNANNIILHSKYLMLSQKYLANVKNVDIHGV